MTKIKLCGLTRECDIKIANELKPDYIGFVFFPKSKRYASPELAAELKAMLDPSIQAVGVFVNAPVEFVAELLEAGTIDVAQLHGKEDEAYVAELRKLTDKPIMKAFRMDSEEDIARANGFSADMVLLDTGEGGTGKTFDWSLVTGMNKPYFLAGGLGPDNIGDAITRIKPYGVDVSSGIETDGLKDPGKMKLFVETVRKY